METIRSISTSPPKARRTFHDNSEGKRQRLLAKILREVARSGQFEVFADYKSALRRRLRQLGIGYQQHELDDALSIVNYSGGLRFAIEHQAQASIDPPGVSLNRAEAGAWLQVIREHLGTPNPVRTMPSIVRMAPAHADLVKAAEMITAEIVACVARCQALEVVDAAAETVKT